MSQSMNQELSEAMLYKIMYEQFMNQVQVIQNLYGDYDKDTLALLEDVPPEKRYRVLMLIKRAYVKVCLEILETEGLIQRLDDRRAKALARKDMDTVVQCDTHNTYNKIWLGVQKALLNQAKSQFAMFRNLALVQAFEQKKKRGSFLGLGKDTLDDVKAKLAQKGRKDDLENNPELTSEQNKSLIDAGLDPKLARKEERVEIV